VAAASLAMLAVVLLRHQGNVRRLLRGEERKL
jgi:glycerol-3-phosphate acyltransferase PlsY